MVLPEKAIIHQGWHPPRTVLAHGCFDVLHVGHIRHLEEARSLGERLVVSVTADPHVGKGAGRPMFSLAERIEALRALKCVDEVHVSESDDAVDAINAIRPHFYVKGIDYADKNNDERLKREIAAVESHFGHFVTTKAAKHSSSAIINAGRFPEATLAYLASAKARGFRDQILAAFERSDKLKIAFVGETIIDEYRYVKPLAKPAKELILAVEAQGEPERFMGGVAAASLHGEWKQIEVVTRSDNPIVKTRFVEAGFNRKLFEVYSHSRTEATDKFLADVVRVAADCEAVVVFDFGHGLMSKDAIAPLLSCGGPKFLAINTQSNAGNYGFNLATRYGGADLMCLDEPEARLAVSMPTEPIAEVMDQLWHGADCRDVICTRGRDGCALQKDSAELEGDARAFVSVPPFASSVVDTIGAGDAFLALAAPLLAAGLDLEAAAFVGNVAGAIKVGVVGHRRHVTRAEIVQTVEALLA